MVRRIVFILLLTAKSQAYSISTHRMITERAVLEYGICQKALGLQPLSDEAVSILSDSNVREDKLLHIKMTNWHFYNPEKNLGAGTIGIGHGSFKNRYDLLVKDLNANHKLSDLGAITHYLQDVTNPAHVAPIYHLSADSFDNYDFTQVLPELVSTKDCIRLANHTVQLDSEKLLDEVVRATLKSMQSPLSYTREGQEFKVMWSEAFWQTTYRADVSKQPGFGHYGLFGNNFGQATISTEDKDIVSVSAQTYQAFARQQIRAALDASLEMIMIFQGSNSSL